MNRFLSVIASTSVLIASLSAPTYTALAFEIQKLVSKYNKAEHIASAKGKRSRRANGFQTHRHRTKTVRRLSSSRGPGRSGKAVVFNPSWGCRTCGYSNGPDLHALKLKIGRRPAKIVLPDGTTYRLR